MSFSGFRRGRKHKADMPTRKIRYFRAGADVDSVTSLRNSQVDKARQSQYQDDDSDVKWDDKSSALKPCRPFWVTHQHCPAWPHWDQPPLNPEKHLQWCMSTKACYVPMLDADYRGDMVHCLAIQGGRAFRDLVTYLTRHPETISFRDSVGNTPLMLACAAHHDPCLVVNFLLARCCFSLVCAENKDGLTALHFAVLNNQPDIVRLLLKRRAKVDAGCREIKGKKYGLTSLHLTLIDHGLSENEPDSCFNILLDNGADISIEMVETSVLNSDGATLRYECNCGGCWSLDLGFDYVVPPALIRPRSLLPGDEDNSQTPDKQTSIGPVFNIAVYMNNYWQVKALLTRFPHIDVNYRDGYDTSCLVHAITNNNADIIHLLLDKGADINSPFSQVNNNSPMHILLSRNRGALEMNQVCGWCCARTSDNVESIYNSLLDCHSLNIHAKNLHGQSLLYSAVSGGHVYACRRLLQMGADPLEVDCSGRSLLYYACMLYTDRLDMLRALLTTGMGHSLPSTSHRDLCSHLSVVYNYRDSAALQILLKGSAVSHQNLQEMLSDAEEDTSFISEEDAKIMYGFRNTLHALLNSTPCLKSLTLLFFSKAAGVGSCAQRATALKQFDPEPDGIAGNFLLSLMKDEGLLE